MNRTPMSTITAPRRGVMVVVVEEGNIATPLTSTNLLEGQESPHVDMPAVGSDHAQGLVPMTQIT